MLKIFHRGGGEEYWEPRIGCLILGHGSQSTSSHLQKGRFLLPKLVCTINTCQRGWTCKVSGKTVRSGQVTGFSKVAGKCPSQLQQSAPSAQLPKTEMLLIPHLGCWAIKDDHHQNYNWRAVDGCILTNLCNRKALLLIWKILPSCRAVGLDLILCRLGFTLSK